MPPQLACSPFTTLDEVLEAACACDLTDGSFDELIEEYIADASDMLYVLSGGRVFGQCTRTVWPLRDSEFCGWPSGGESWVEWDGADSIPLQGPKTSVLEVTVDGVALTPSEYGLINGNKLFRLSSKRWPAHNDITLPDTEVGTFTITYSFGYPPSLSVRRAAIELVCQMIKGDSATPSRLRGIVSANVQGVSVTMSDDPIDSIGLPEVSKFMDVYGNSGRPVASVWAPETNHGWHLVTVGSGSEIEV